MDWSTPETPTVEAPADAPISAGQQPAADADLERLTAAWPTLSLPIKSAVMALVDAAQVQRTARGAE